MVIDLTGLPIGEDYEAERDSATQGHDDAEAHERVYDFGKSDCRLHIGYSLLNTTNHVMNRAALRRKYGKDKSALVFEMRNEMRNKCVPQNNAALSSSLRSLIGDAADYGRLTELLAQVIHCTLGMRCSSIEHIGVIGL